MKPKRRREEKLLDHEYRHREFSDSIQGNNIHMIGILEEEGKKE